MNKENCALKLVDEIILCRSTFNVNINVNFNIILEQSNCALVG